MSKRIVLTLLYNYFSPKDSLKKQNNTKKTWYVNKNTLQNNVMSAKQKVGHGLGSGTLEVFSNLSDSMNTKSMLKNPQAMDWLIQTL